MTMATGEKLHSVGGEEEHHHSTVQVQLPSSCENAIIVRMFGTEVIQK